MFCTPCPYEGISSPGSTQLTDCLACAAGQELRADWGGEGYNSTQVKQALIAGVVCHPCPDGTAKAFRSASNCHHCPILAWPAPGASSCVCLFGLLQYDSITNCCQGTTLPVLLLVVFLLFCCRAVVFLWPCCASRQLCWRHGRQYTQVSTSITS